jgi:hypothetical protein
MADFQSQAMGLTGLTIDASSTTPSRAEFSTFLNDGVIDVTNRWLLVKPQDIDSFTREGAEQTSNGFNPGTNKIVSVIRESGTDGEWYPCSKKPINLQYLVTDVDSLHYASKYNPVYMITQNRNVHVYPAPSGAGNDGFKVLYVNYSPEETDGTALDHASTGIKWFPEDKVYLVILYASMRSVQAKMADTTITDLTITVVPPDVPLLASTSISFSQAAPTYNSPTTTISGTAWATAYPDQYSAITTAWTALNAAVDRVKTGIWDDSGNYSSGDFTKVKDALDNAQTIIDDGASSPTGAAAGDAATYLYTDEDTELLQGALGIASTELQRASLHVQETDLITKTAIQEAQGFAQEVQSRLSNVGTKVSEYQIKVQDALHEFNEANAAYQAQLQVSIQNAQLENQDEQFKVQKYQAEYAGYTAEVNEQVQAYTQNLQADGVGYQWLQDQYNRLKAEYDQAFIIAAPKPPPQAAPARR